MLLSLVAFEMFLSVVVSHYQIGEHRLPQSPDIPKLIIRQESLLFSLKHQAFGTASLWSDSLTDHALGPGVLEAEGQFRHILNHHFTVEFDEAHIFADVDVDVFVDAAGNPLFAED